MDIDSDRKRFSDMEVKAMMAKLCGGENAADFQRLPEGVGNEVIAKLREEGISIRQIARLTG